MKTNYLVTIAASIFIGSVMNSCTDPKDGAIGDDDNYQGVPSNIISSEQGVRMKQEYQSKIAPFIKMSKPNEDYDPTQFTYIELDSLKKYIAFLDNVEKLNGTKITGLRIYNAKYPDQEEANIKSRYPGRETFFFAPTINIGAAAQLSEVQKQFPNLQNVPFYVASKDKNNIYKGELIPIEGLMMSQDVRKSRKEASLQQNPGTGIGEGSVLLNDMNMIPPPRDPNK